MDPGLKATLVLLMGFLFYRAIRPTRKESSNADRAASTSRRLRAVERQSGVVADRLRAENGALRSQVANMNRALEQRASEIERLKAEVATARREVDILERRLRER